MVRFGSLNIWVGPGPVAVHGCPFWGQKTGLNRTCEHYSQVLGDGTAGLSSQVLGNSTAGHDDSPEDGIGNTGGDEDVGNKGGDDDDGVGEGSRSGDSGVGDQQARSKVVELDDVRHTPEPRGGNTSAAKLANAGMAPDSSEATTSNNALVPVECEGESGMRHYLVHNIYLHNLISKCYNESWARSFSRS